MNLKETLEQRGYLHQYTDEKVFDLFTQWWKNFYFGVDLSADSMTIGNFVALMMALRVMSFGNKCYLLAWWATSTIGNPSGKDTERPILSPEKLAHNQEKISQQFKTMCDNVSAVTGKQYEFEIINNADFYTNMNTLDYLRDIGRYITVNRMLNKDIVKRRVEDPDKSITYAEFSYMLIMGYDFYHLFTNNDVIMEVWWSDEWDGILSWIELISKKTWKTAYWITNKLITDSSGKKFWKSEGNAIWISPEKNSPYVCYNYFMNAMDDDIERYCNLLTFLSQEEIASLVEKHQEDPSLRLGQEKLAYHVTALIFWEEEAKHCKIIQSILYAESSDITMEKIQSLTDTELHALNKATWWATVSTTDWLRILESLVLTELYESNSEAKKAIKWNAIMLNGRKITDVGYELTKEDFVNSVALLKKGKKNYATLLLTE